MGKQIELWAFSTKIVLEKWMTYTSHKVFRSVSVLIRETDCIFLLYFLARVCGNIKGWRFEEMALCLAFASLSYGILVIFFTGLRDFKILKGRTDMYFLKPTGILWQILLEDTDWSAAMGHISLGTIMLVWGLVGCKLQLTWINVLFFILNLSGAVMIMAAIWLFCCAVQSFTNGKVYLKNIFLVLGEIMRYPLGWFPLLLRNMMTYIVPFGFVTYYPVLQLLGRNEDTPEIFQYISLPIGVTMYVVAYIIWRISIYFYRR